MEAWTKFKQYIPAICWTAVVTFALTLTVGLKTGWLVTANSAEKISKSAVITSKAQICVERFKADGEFAIHSSAMKEIDTWKWDDYLKEHGTWAVTPGEKSADYYVTDQCAEGLKKVVL